MDANGGLPAAYQQNPRNVIHLSQTPVFADSFAYYTEPRLYQVPTGELNLYDPLGDSFNGISNANPRYMGPLMARHGSRPATAAPKQFDWTQRLPGMIDMALYDGHVEKVPLENLWSYYWNATWIPRKHPHE